MYGLRRGGKGGLNELLYVWVLGGWMDGVGGRTYLRVGAHGHVLVHGGLGQSGEAALACVRGGGGE